MTTIAVTYSDNTLWYIRGQLTAILETAEDTQDWSEVKGCAGHALRAIIEMQACNELPNRAAAPELLAALQDILADWDDSHGRTWVVRQASINKARTAIAKATQ